MEILHQEQPFGTRLSFQTTPAHRAKVQREHEQPRPMYRLISEHEQPRFSRGEDEMENHVLHTETSSRPSCSPPWLLENIV